MKTKTKLLTLALFTISICPTKTMGMMHLVRRVGLILIRGRGGICRPPTGNRSMSELRTKLWRCASQQTKVFKVGGSVLTHKGGPNNGATNYSAIHNVVEQTADYLYDNPENKQVYIATGAGALAHKMAHQYKNNLEDGAPEIIEMAKILGVEFTNALNKEFQEKSIDKKAVLFDSRYTIIEGGRIKSFITEHNRKHYNASTLSSWMEKEDIIPVFNATIAFNKEGESTILSGDAIAFHLAQQENVYPGFLSSAGGIYDENGTIMQILDLATAKQLFDGNNAVPIMIDEEGIPIMLHMGTSSYEHDVSGGPRTRVDRFSDSPLQRMFILPNESLRDYLEMESPIDFFKKQIKGTMLVKTDGWAVCSGYTL